MSAPTPYRPFGIKAVNAIGGVLGKVGVKPSLEPDALIAAAQKQAGLSDFGGDEFRVGLEKICESLNGEARLNTIGRIAAAGNVGSRLATRLRVVERRKH